VSQIPLAAFRPWRRAALAGKAMMAHDARALFNRLYADLNPRANSVLLISDENMIGTSNPIVREGRLYPELSAKLGRAAAMLADHSVAIFISIRCCDAFYAAIYCEALRYRERGAFRDFAMRLDPVARRWPQVLADMATLFPTSPITVWPYESFREEEAAIFGALVGRLVASEMVLTGEVMRPSMSQRAVDTTEVLAKCVGRFAASQLVAGVESLMPKTRGYPAFDPWTAEEKSRLCALNEEDMLALNSNKRYNVLAQNWMSHGS
jgi:hypothetical protein